MRTLYVCALSLAAISLTGCVNTENLSDPVTDTLARTPLMYKPDIQQGNVISQEQINKLEPGMTRQQVQFLLGTPMLIDTFHRNRWDYIYTVKKGSGGGKTEQKRVALHFNDDQLVKIEGNFRPQPNNEPPATDIVVSVPDHKSRKKGMMESALQSVGLMKKPATEQMQDKADAQIKASDKTGDGAMKPAEETTATAESDEAGDQVSTPDIETTTDSRETTGPTELPQPEAID